MKVDRELFFSSEGRSSRGEYWTVLAVLFFVSLLGGFLEKASGDVAFGVAIYLVVMIGTMIADFNIIIKRLHDLGLSGWWFGVFFVADSAIAAVGGLKARQDPDIELLTIGVLSVLMVVGVVILGVIPGQEGPNRFNPSFKEWMDPEDWEEAED